MKHRHYHSAAIGSKLFFATATTVAAVALSILHLASALLPWKSELTETTHVYVWNYAIDVSFASVVYLLIALLAGQLLPRDERPHWISLAVVLWLFFWSGILYSDFSGKALVWAWMAR